ncbi:MAG: GNAT family N-acetyltransferase [Thermoanaerobaculia bacterium]
MTEFVLSITDPSSSELASRLAAGLTEHAHSFADGPGFQPLEVVAHDAQGGIAGGITGRLNWSWLHVNLLWVAEPARGRGLGSRLLARIEDEARGRGCRYAHLDTFSYQALPFYERHGYLEFGRLEDYPPGQSRHFLRKEL